MPLQNYSLCFYMGVQVEAVEPKSLWASKEYVKHTIFQCNMAQTTKRDLQCKGRAKGSGKH